MNTYRLDPIPSTFGDPSWHRSSVREPVWVKAASPDAAREKVALATLNTAPRVLGAPITFSPWYNDTLVICVLDTSRTDVPEDAIIRADGRRLE
jgi:hypothetical protein